MTDESNEQLRTPRGMEAYLTSYLDNTKAYRGAVATDATREVMYQVSLISLSNMIEAICADPREVDRMLREVMPARFDKKNRLDPGAWEETLQLAPVELVKRGYITLDREDVEFEFFERLLDWTLRNSAGHGVPCAATSTCAHELPSREVGCPVRATVGALLGEVTLLYYRLHGEYTSFALVNKLDFMQKRIEMIGDLIVRSGVNSRDEMQDFLQRTENSAIIYASKVNGLDKIE